MIPSEIIIINLEEIRRRSIKLWKGIPPENYFWQPDINAMNFLEMVRHVLEGEHLFHIIVKNRKDLDDYISPWTNLPYTDLQAELEFAEPFRVAFLKEIREFNPIDFSTIEIIRSEKGQQRQLGDYLQRVAYHETVHTGQMLSYMRTLRLEIPQIWD